MGNRMEFEHPDLFPIPRGRPPEFAVQPQGLSYLNPSVTFLLAFGDRGQVLQSIVSLSFFFVASQNHEVLKTGGPGFGRKSVRDPRTVPRNQLGVCAVDKAYGTWKLSIWRWLLLHSAPSSGGGGDGSGHHLHSGPAPQGCLGTPASGYLFNSQRTSAGSCGSALQCISNYLAGGTG